MLLAVGWAMQPRGKTNTTSLARVPVTSNVGANLSDTFCTTQASKQNK
jgi:hypothetical protein